MVRYIFQLVLCGFRLGVTSQRSVSPEYITPSTVKILIRFVLFQHVTNSHDSEVKKILNSSSRRVKLCHPLCSCDQCEKVLDRHRNDPEAVTVFSRDDLGRTALHIAADYGELNAAFTRYVARF